MEDEGRRAGRLRLRGEARCPGRGPACINSVGQRLIECEAPPAGAGRTLGLGRLSGQIGLKVGIPCQLAPRLGEKMDARGEAPCHQRSEERRVGKEWCRTCKSRWAQYQ